MRGRAFFFLRTLLRHREVREGVYGIRGAGQRLSPAGKRWGIRALVVLGIVAIFPRNYWLTDVALPIVKIDHGSEKIAWLADNRCLLLSTRKEKRSETEAPGGTSGSDWQGRVDLIDPGSHARTPLVALSALLHRTGLAFDSFRTSPDGKWVLWQNAYSPAHPLPYVYVAKPDGTACRRWIRGTCDQDQECYLDAGHIMQVANQVPAIIVHDLEHPARDQKYMTVKEARGVLDQYVSLHPPALRIVDDYPDIRLQCAVSYYPIETSLFSEASPLNAVFGSVQVHSRRLPLPKGATLRYGWSSPQQQAIVYVLDFTRTHPVLAWLHRYFRKIPIDQTTTEELWISRGDGTGMRSLGTIPVQPDPESIQEYRLQDLQWLPDGKHVSFIYRGTLYKMATETP